MLQSLTVSNIVLIEQLTLRFEEGLTVLTGETGAGKSILLDALGLTLGSRANFGLIRNGADQAHVTASFTIDEDHPIMARLDAAGIPGESTLILRRRLRMDGKSSASMNDVPVSLAMLREIGDMLVEIQGQFEGRGLLDVATHIALLDKAANHADALAKLEAGWHSWQKTKHDLLRAQQELEQARSDEEWLRDAVEQLDKLSPQADEEASLAGQREMLSNVGRIGEGLGLVEDTVFGESGAQSVIGKALGALEKVAPLAGGALDQSLAAMERASAELGEAGAAISSAAHELEADPHRLQEVDDRLHELRQQARKHACDVSQLPEIHEKLAQSLAGLEDTAGTLAGLTETERQWSAFYHQNADIVSRNRQLAAAALDRVVMTELPPLKLENASFVTNVSPLPEQQWGPLGRDQVRFEASTNKGMRAGPIDRIASGGELARFLLALKVALEDQSATRTLIFDEVDSGVGGAVAAAVGDRLSRLGNSVQTLVVTHSPQVAAKGRHHMRIAKVALEDSVVSGTEPLDSDQRVEEIARMLAGETITPQARAAATALMEG
ncbi:MAG: DNA repair protein RecN [Bacteroidetes bacterium]|nr:DNA repair protein RecN [Bacteroidota bacterium]